MTKGKSYSVADKSISLVSLCMNAISSYHLWHRFVCHPHGQPRKHTSTQNEIEPSRRTHMSQSKFYRDIVPNNLFPWWSFACSLRSRRSRRNTRKVRPQGVRPESNKIRDTLKIPFGGRCQNLWNGHDPAPLCLFFINVNNFLCFFYSQGDFSRLFFKPPFNFRNRVIPAKKTSKSEKKKASNSQISRSHTTDFRQRLYREQVYFGSLGSLNPVSSLSLQCEVAQRLILGLGSLSPPTKQTTQLHFRTVFKKSRLSTGECEPA